MRGLHPPPRRAPPGKGPHRDLRRRHRQPFFTTDSGAALRAIEIEADLLLKATKVDGVYDKDPRKFPDAKRFDTLTYDEVIRRGLEVMDTAAFALCRDSAVPLRIYDLSVPGNLMNILRGENIGTLVEGRG